MHPAVKRQELLLPLTSLQPILLRLLRKILKHSRKSQATRVSTVLVFLYFSLLFHLKCLNLENLLIFYCSTLTWDGGKTTNCFSHGSLQGTLPVIPNPRRSWIVLLRLRETLGNGNVPSFLGLQFSLDYMEISFRSTDGRAVLWQPKTLNQNKTKVR